MGIVLQIVGYGWFVLGLFNFGLANKGVTDDMQLGLSVIVHMMVYFGPGLMIGGLGSLIAKKS